MTGRGLVCPACKVRAIWSDYFCPACGAHHDALYRADHPDPAVARTLTRAGIEAEYAAEGIPFRHNPRLEVNVSYVSVSPRTMRKRKARAT